MTLDSSGIGLMSLGSSNTNNLRFYGGTTNRETMNIYRVSDSNGLVIALRTTSASNKKTYPLLNLISTDNPSSFVGGVSATSADLFTINWNDKPTVGFTSQTHRFCFNVGNGQPYKTGYPHTCTLATSADVFCINPAGSSPTPSSGCLYLVSDTINKMIFNTNTPYSSSFGTAPLTLNSGNIYIKASNALNDGSANYDMPIFMESSNASPIGFGLQLNNATNATSTNSAYFGTTTTNDLVMMTANTRRLTISSAGRAGIGTGSPSATLHVSGSNSYTVGVGGTSNCYQYNVQGNIWSNLGLGPVSVTVSAIFSSSIFCVQSIYTSSDRRLKENITPISISLEHYDKLEPVSYNWKGESKAKLGLIAQDAMKVR
ncbi:putative intramolecular chaperone auto-processing domain-containing protein [Plasmopara halstedii]